MGEKLTVMETEFPGSRKKGSGILVLTTENGAARAPSVPFPKAVKELDGFVIVMIWSDDVPTVTFLKSTDGGVMEMLLDTTGVTTLTVPALPFEHEGAQSI